MNIVDLNIFNGNKLSTMQTWFFMNGSVDIFAFDEKGGQGFKTHADKGEVEKETILRTSFMCLKCI